MFHKQNEISDRKTKRKKKTFILNKPQSCKVKDDGTTKT